MLLDKCPPINLFPYIIFITDSSVTKLHEEEVTYNKMPLSHHLIILQNTHCMLYPKYITKENKYINDLH